MSRVIQEYERNRIRIINNGFYILEYGATEKLKKEIIKSMKDLRQDWILGAEYDLESLQAEEWGTNRIRDQKKLIAGLKKETVNIDISSNMIEDKIGDVALSLSVWKNGQQYDAGYVHVFGYSEKEYPSNDVEEDN